MTPDQKRAWDLAQEGLSQRAIAETLGKSRRTIRGLLKKAKAADPAIQDAMDEFSIETSGSVERVWFKNKGLTVQVKGPSGGGEDFLTQVVEAMEGIPAAPLIPLPPLPLNDEMMVVYPFFDAHLGLRAHAEISGEDMDLDKGVERVLGAMKNIMRSTPAAKRGVILLGGDLTHQTDDLNRTRRSGHILDVDGRNVFTVMAGIECVAHLVEAALTKHGLIDIYSVPGNHDPQNWETILIALRERYRENPRVRVYVNFQDDNASFEFCAIEHGQVGVFVHHGDKRTPKDLAMFCACEFPEIWGRTRYRLLLTGHRHHAKVEEFPGIYWMQMPAISARDAHAAGGYGSNSMMTALSFDLVSEVSRYTARI